MQPKVGKSPGIYGIPAEVYQHGGEAVLNKLQDLFTNCWEKEAVPQDLRDAVIVSLYKNKGDKSDCSNYIGIPLLSVAGRILARFLLNRLIPTIAQKNTQKSQRGFRSNRGTADMIFALRQIQETCRGQNMGLYAAFLDLTKAFGCTVKNPGAPWLSPQFLTILRQLHEGQQDQVKHNGSLSGSFLISNSVKRDAFWPPLCSPSSSASCFVKQKRNCQTASTSVPEQIAVCSTVDVSLHSRRPFRNSSLRCCLLTTAPFSPTRRKLYSTSSTASLMHSRTAASPSSA